jgi:hypothetical protein
MKARAITTVETNFAKTLIDLFTLLIELGFVRHIYTLGSRLSTWIFHFFKNVSTDQWGAGAAFFAFFRNRLDLTRADRLTRRG